MAYSTIDIGAALSNRGSGGNPGTTYLLLANPANASGVLTTFKMYFSDAEEDPSGVKIGTFYGSSTDYTMRDKEDIGVVTKGSTQTFTGKNCDVSSDDLIGLYAANGDIEWSTSGGTGAYTKAGDYFDGSTYTYSLSSGREGSFYAEGVTICDAPTNVSATENDSIKVVITWTKSTGATGYRVYRDGADISGLLGDVATYDDTTAAAPVITAGNTMATDGSYGDKVALSLTGTSITDGTQYTYTIKAVNEAGLSSASTSDTGYRLSGTLNYQWRRSLGDASFAGFEDIAGATDSTYDDTTTQEDGLSASYESRYYRVKISATGYDDVYSVVNRGCRDAGGRYYCCKLSATGSETVYSTSNRGYRATQLTSFIAEIMRVHYVPSLGGF